MTATTDRRQQPRREDDRLQQAIIEELLKLESLPYGDSDGAELRTLLHRVRAMESDNGGNDHE